MCFVAYKLFKGSLVLELICIWGIVDDMLLDVGIFTSSKNLVKFISSFLSRSLSSVRLVFLWKGYAVVLFLDLLLDPSIDLNKLGKE